MFCGKSQLLRVFQTLLKESADNSCPEISIWGPAADILFQGIYYILENEDYKNLKINQFIDMLKNPASRPEEDHQNIKILSSVLSAALPRIGRYQIYCLYHSHIYEDTVCGGFPYYILFSGSVLLLSGDLRTGWLERSPSIIQFFKEKGSILMRNANRLLVPSSGAEFIELPKDGFRYSMGLSPDWSSVINGKMVERLLVQGCPELIKKLAVQTDYNGENIESVHIIFDQKGVQEFLTSGYLGWGMNGYMRHLTSGERVQIVRMLHKRCSDSRFVIRAVNPMVFSIGANLNIRVCHRRRFMAVIREVSGKETCGSIEDISAAEAFYDFIRYLPGSCLTYGQKETQDIIMDILTASGVSGKYF